MSNEFFLGRILDEATKKTSTEPLMYDPDDLTTHAVITGMTGSGKTGLGVGILEEAALAGIPAMILDPKGDLTNLVLHFPELRGSDFAPWVDPQSAQQKGMSLEEFAQQTADSWKKGLADWGMTQPNIEALRDAARYTIYTPGSTAGVPINIVSTFDVPNISWEDNAEVLRERISSTIIALLGLVGMKDIDPLRSREHILLSNLLENAWREGHALTMVDLIAQIQTPPFSMLGAFPLDNFFPAKDRMELAFLINNFLASPSFQSWNAGVPMDFDQLLFTEDGKPRHNIFYLSHLSEEERMFFVSLFFATFESWMRTQRGTGHLRSLIYFDEVMGYLPPVANPPSRELILRMLKQARAYGVGLILATQNPVDVDYKALSNAGTWLIGRLQTENDVNRLMDGLRAAGGDVQPTEIRDKISSLPKRTFLIHNVHGGKPSIFATRWVMNYLAGPMTRSQIPALNDLDGIPDKPVKANGAKPAGSTTSAAAGASARPANDLPSAVSADSPGSIPTASMASGSQRPKVLGGLQEIFLPVTLNTAQALAEAGLKASPDANLEKTLQYVPHFFQQYTIQFSAAKYNINHVERKAYIAEAVPSSSMVDWKNYTCASVEAENVLTAPENPAASYAPFADRMLPTGSLSTFKTAMIDWIYRNVTLSVYANAGLKMYAAPGEGKEAFVERCRKEAKRQMDEEFAVLTAKQKKEKTALEDKVEIADHRVSEQKQKLDQRQLEELGAGGELLISLVGKRKKSVSKNLTKRRMTAEAKENYKEAQLVLRQVEDQLKALEAKHKGEVDDLVQKWTNTAHTVTVEQISPLKKDILNELFGVAWLPCYRVMVGSEERRLPAWK